MDCWSQLQLPEDADERTIKRSYARCLKTLRPEEDAEGFQRLREAYEQARSHARQRQEPAAGTQAPSPLLAVQAEPQNLREWSRLLDIDSPAPEARTVDQTQRRLLQGLTPENLAQRWQQAQLSDCAPGFEAGLLQHCFERPQVRVAIASWAVEHLQWLTPWQQVPMSAGQQQTLAQTLLQHYCKSLQAHLEVEDDRAFLQQLAAYDKEPWLQVFDQRQRWQSQVLQLLNDHSWSLALLEQVCQLLHWDDKNGVHPEPAEAWESLMQRRQQENFYRLQQLKSEDERIWEPDILSAHLLLKPMSARQQQHLLRNTDQHHWQAFHRLAQMLSLRYPALLERLPQPDVYYWLRYLQRPVAEQSWTRLWAGTSLALALYFLGQNHYSPGFSIMLAAALGWVPVWIGLLFMSRWIRLAPHVIVQDLWLSERWIPKAFDPEGKWLVLRHGIPQLALLALFGAIQGTLGLLTYLGMILLNLLQSQRVGRIDPQLSASHPWLTALHWAHWSPLQMVFLPLMVLLCVLCHLYYPGFPLTSLYPP